MREEPRRLSWDEPAPEDLMDDFLAEWADEPPPELDNLDMARHDSRMDTATTAAFPLRVARTTTGTVHAAREDVVPVRKFTDAGWIQTDETTVELVKACGYDPNTMRRVAGVGNTTAAVTCRKCLRKLA